MVGGLIRAEVLGRAATLEKHVKAFRDGTAILEEHAKLTASGHRLLELANSYMEAS